MSVPGDADFRPTFKVEIATESLMGTDDTAVSVPFVAGGPSGVLGWSWWTNPTGGAQGAPVAVQVQPSGALQGQLLMTQSGVQAQAYQFGIQRLFPITGGRRYAFSVDVKRWGIAPLQYYLNLETMTADGFTTVGSAYYPQAVAPEDQQTFFVQMTVPTSTQGVNIRVTLGAYSLGSTFPQQLVYSNLTIFDIGAVEQAPEPVWHDVTCDVRAISNRFGRERFSGRFEVGVMTYELRNESGEYSYQRNHPWGLTPGRLIRAQCEIGGDWYPMAMGIIDDIKVEVEPDGTAIARIHAQDPTNLLSLQQTPNVSGNLLSYYSHLRVMALERVIGYPSWMMSTYVGEWFMQLITQSGRTLRDEIGVTCDTEGASFYADRAGRLTFRGRAFGQGTTQASLDKEWRMATANLVANTWEETGASSDSVPDLPVTTTGTLGWLVLDGANGSTVQTPNRGEFSPTGNITFTVRATADSWASGAQQALLSKYNVVGGGGYEFLIGTTGSLALTLDDITSGVSRTLTVAGAGLVNGQVYWLEFFYDATAKTLRVRKSSDPVDKPISSIVWTLVGTSAVHAGDGPQTNDRALFLGSRTTGTARFTGTIDRAQMSIGPTVVASPSFAASQVGDRQLQDIQGNQWSLAGGATIATKPTPVPGMIPNISGPYELDTEWSSERVINSVTLANRGGIARNFLNPDSVREYGTHTYQRMDYVFSAYDSSGISEALMLQTRANDFLEGNASPTLRLTSVAFRPHQVCRTLEDWQWVLKVFLNHVVRVCYINDQGNWGYVTSTRVQAIDVDINPTEWRYKLTLDKPLSFTDFKAVQGGWDIERWDEAIWDDDPTTDQAYWNSGQTWSDPLTRWGA